ncbi:MAG: hypothetical protein ACRD1K_08845 [Acidimicrobiales bacterium]
MGERPPADPELLLASWMQWEKGALPPGKVMSEMKRGGLREFLESAVQARREPAAG